MQAFFLPDKKPSQPLDCFNVMPFTRDRAILKRQGSYFLFESTFLEQADKAAATKHNWPFLASHSPASRIIYKETEFILLAWRCLTVNHTALVAAIQSRAFIFPHVLDA